MLICALPACTFDPSGLAGDGSASRPDASPEPDASPAPDASPPDASGPCGGAPLTLSLRIDGASAAPADGEPYAHVLVGDLVEISAEGSCSADGALTYAWEITPADGVQATAEPNLRSETFTVYAENVGDYMVELTITNGSGAQLGSTVLGFRVHGWTAATTPAEMGEIRDLTPGAGNLWIASVGGAYLMPLDGPADAFTLVNDQADGSDIPDGLGAVIFDGNDRIWFGSRLEADHAWRIALAPGTMTTAEVRYREALDDNKARVDDFALAEGTTVAAATNRGITEAAADAESFTGREFPDGEIANALASGAGRRMAGSSRGLHDLASGQTFDIVSGNNDNIIALAVDAENQLLWAGTSDRGIVQFDLEQNETVTIYDEDNSGLGSDRIRALVVETAGEHAGDVWAATSTGIARYIRRRQTWIHMDQAHGLIGHTDVQAITVDVDSQSGRRAIYAGTSAGLVYSRVP